MRHTAGDHEVVAFFEVHDFFGGLLGVIEEHVGGVEFLADRGDHAPREREAAIDLFAGSESDDIDGRSEPRDHPHGHAGDRADDDRFRLDVDRHAADGVGDTVDDIFERERVIVEPFPIVDFIFRRFRDRGHHFNRLFGVFPGGGFAGKHNGGGAVVDGVGDVGDFGAGRSGRRNHRFEHFRRGYDPLAEPSAFFDDFLLDGGESFGRDFDAHIAATDHDAGAFFEDAFEVVDSGLVFDFSDEFDIGPVVLRHEVFDFNEIRRA